jgi:hypothetical protein
MTMIFNTGKTATGLSFSDTYPELKANISNTFYTFAHKCLGKPFTSTLYQLGSYKYLTVVDKIGDAVTTESQTALQRAKSSSPSVHVGETGGSTSLGQNIPKSTEVEDGTKNER